MGFDLSVPRYMQVAAYIRDQVAEGRLRCGDKVKSELELAREFNMARMTVRRGLDELVAQGVLRREHRRGTFVAGKPGQFQFNAANDELGTPMFLRARGMNLRVETLDGQAHQLRFWQQAVRCVEERFERVRAGVVSAPWDPEANERPVLGDVVALCVWSLPHYKKRGLLRLMENRPSVSGVLPCFRDGLEYGIPFSCSVPSLAVNRDLLQRVGVGDDEPYHDFDDFIDLLQKARRSLPGISPLACSPTLPLYLASGDNVETEAGQLLVPARVKKVFADLLGLGQAAVNIGADAYNAFMSGQVLFLACSPHALDYDRLPRDFRLSCHALPLAPGSRWRYTPMVLGVSARSEFAHDAERVARFMAGPEVQQAMIEARAGIPANSELLGAAASRLRFRELAAVLDNGLPLDGGAMNLSVYVDTVFKPISTAILQHELELEQGMRDLTEHTAYYHKKSKDMDALQVA